MTTAPVLPSLPERFYTQESPWLEILAWHRARPGDEAYDAARAVEEALRSMLHDYARRAIESLSRAPAEPVAWVQHWPGFPDRVFDMTVIDPRKTTWGSGITYTLLYAHPTESAGPAPAGMLLVSEAALRQIARAIEGLKRECGMDPESPQAIRNAQYMSLAYAVRKLGESHEG